jgi:DNA polymerase-3 subunit epsilon
MKETDRIDHHVCPTPIEAAVREVRLIHEHRPRFNRRSKRPEKRVFVRLTKERYPRLSVVARPPTDGSAWIGPVASRRIAEQIADSIHEVTTLRRCTPRIGASTRFAACALAAMGRCLAPCEGGVGVDVYAETAATVASTFAGDIGTIADALLARMRHLGAAGRFEEAAGTRDRLRALVSAVRSTRQLTSLRGAGVVVASRRAGDLVDVLAMRDGVFVASARVASAAVAACAQDLRARALAARVEVPAEGPGEEADVLNAWLHTAGVVIHWAENGFASPVAGGRTTEELHRRLTRVHRSTGRAAAELAQKRRRLSSDPSMQEEQVATAK